MHQAVFLDAHIHKATEVGDVGHDARQGHAFLQVVYGLHVLVELEYLDGLSRVAARFLQFGHDVRQGRETYLVGYIFLDVYLASQFLVLDEGFYRAPQVLGYELYYGIAFRMYRRVVQRILGSRNAKKAGTLFKSLGTHARHFHQLLAGGKCSVLCPVVHNVLGEGRAKTRYISQQMSAGGVQVHTHRVHTALYGHVERFLQGSLVHIVLVLAYTDALGFNLH